MAVMRSVLDSAPLAPWQCGTVEIVDPRIITRLKTDDQLPGSTRSVSGWDGGGPRES